MAQCLSFCPVIIGAGCICCLSWAPDPRHALPLCLKMTFLSNKRLSVSRILSFFPSPSLSCLELRDCVTLHLCLKASVTNTDIWPVSSPRSDKRTTHPSNSAWPNEPCEHAAALAALVLTFDPTDADSKHSLQLRQYCCWDEFIHYTYIHIYISFI